MSLRQPTPSGIARLVGGRAGLLTAAGLVGVMGLSGVVRSSGDPAVAETPVAATGAAADAASPNTATASGALRAGLSTHRKPLLMALRR